MQTAEQIADEHRLFSTAAGRSERIFLVRRNYDLARIEEEPAHDLADLLGYWRQLHIAGRLPRLLSPAALAQIGVIDRVHLVDTRAGDPAAYYFRVFAPGSRFEGGRDFTGLRLGDYAEPLYARATQEDYASVVASGRPRYQHVLTVYDGRPSQRFRLILPLSRDGDKVDKLAVAWRYEQLKLSERKS